MVKSNQSFYSTNFYEISFLSTWPKILVCNDYVDGPWHRWGGGYCLVCNVVVQRWRGLTPEVECIYIYIYIYIYISTPEVELVMENRCVKCWWWYLWSGSIVAGDGNCMAHTTWLIYYLCLGHTIVFIKKKIPIFRKKIQNQSMWFHPFAISSLGFKKRLKALYGKQKWQ
jgi:hypothetical protein